MMVMVIVAWCHSDVTGHWSHDTPGGSQGAVSLLGAVCGRPSQAGADTKKPDAAGSA